jgi:hypothetical protein
MPIAMDAMLSLKQSIAEQYADAHVDAPDSFVGITTNQWLTFEYDLVYDKQEHSIHFHGPDHMEYQARLWTDREVLSQEGPYRLCTFTNESTKPPLDIMCVGDDVYFECEPLQFIHCRCVNTIGSGKDVTATLAILHDDTTLMDKTIATRTFQLKSVMRYRNRIGVLSHHAGWNSEKQSQKCNFSDQNGFEYTLRYESNPYVGPCDRWIVVTRRNS